MRYALATILIYALGIASASALPGTSLHRVSVTTASPIVQIAKHNRRAAVHRKKHTASGIHPLVGSGDY